MGKRKSAQNFGLYFIEVFVKLETAADKTRRNVQITPGQLTEVSVGSR